MILKIYFYLKNKHVASSEKVFISNFIQNKFYFKEDYRIKKLENFKGKDFQMLLFLKLHRLFMIF